MKRITVFLPDGSKESWEEDDNYSTSSYSRSFSIEDDEITFSKKLTGQAVNVKKFSGMPYKIELEEK